MAETPKFIKVEVDAIISNHVLAMGDLLRRQQRKLDRVRDVAQKLRNTPPGGTRSYHYAATLIEEALEDEK